MYKNISTKLFQAVDKLNQEIKDGEYSINNIELNILKIVPSNEKTIDVTIEVCNTENNVFSKRFFVLQKGDLIGYKLWLALHDVLEVGDFE